MKVYAFDVDETLEISNGPISLQSIIDLKKAGHIIGICGNWGLFVTVVEKWYNLVSFFKVSAFPGVSWGPGEDKGWYLSELTKYIKADEYVLVGNVYGDLNSLGYFGASYDSDAAKMAGWRFIKEDDFANGVR